MIVFYQIWLAKCWVLGRFFSARFADYWTRMMARLLRSPTPQVSIHWYMNYPYSMTWLHLGGGLGGLAPFAPHLPHAVRVWPAQNPSCSIRRPGWMN
jgi:hypothetical protein